MGRRRLEVLSLYRTVPEALCTCGEGGEVPRSPETLSLQFSERATLTTVARLLN